VFCANRTLGLLVNVNWRCTGRHTSCLDSLAVLCSFKGIFFVVLDLFITLIGVGATCILLACGEKIYD